MQYEVRYVHPNALPALQDWAIARQGDMTVLFVKRGRMTPHLLQRAWRGGDLLADERLQREHGLPHAL